MGRRLQPGPGLPVDRRDERERWQVRPEHHSESGQVPVRGQAHARRQGQRRVGQDALFDAQGHARLPSGVQLHGQLRVDKQGRDRLRVQGPRRDARHVGVQASGDRESHQGLRIQACARYAQVSRKQEENDRGEERGRSAGRCATLREQRSARPLGLLRVQEQPGQQGAQRRRAGQCDVPLSGLSRRERARWTLLHTRLASRSQDRPLHHFLLEHIILYFRKQFSSIFSKTFI